MKRISISRKLLLGFLSVLILLVAVVVISYTQFRSVERTYTDLIKDRTAKLLVIKNMVIDVKSLQVELRNFVVEDNDKSAQDFQAFYEDYQKISDGLRAEVTTEVMIDLLDRSSEISEEYYAYAQNVMDLKDKEEAMRLQG